MAAHRRVVAASPATIAIAERIAVSDLAYVSAQAIPDGRRGRAVSSVRLYSRSGSTLLCFENGSWIGSSGLWLEHFDEPDFALAIASGTGPIRRQASEPESLVAFPTTSHFTNDPARCRCGKRARVYAGLWVKLGTCWTLFSAKTRQATTRTHLVCWLCTPHTDQTALLTTCSPCLSGQ